MKVLKVSGGDYAATLFEGHTTENTPLLTSETVAKIVEEGLAHDLYQRFWD